MRYDAVAVGPLDLAAGTDLLAKPEGRPLTWLSANILNAANAPVFPSFIVKAAGQTRIGIIGLTNQRASLPEGLHMGDWRSILPAQLLILSKKCDKIILLSNLSQNDNEEIAQRYPAINIIISADPQMAGPGPFQRNNTLLAGTLSQGKYLMALDIAWGNSGKWKSDLNRRMDALKSSLESVNTQIATAETTGENSPDRSGQLVQLKNTRQDLMQQIGTLKAQYEAENPKGSVPSTFTAKTITLSASLPKDAKVEQIVSGIKQQINTLNSQTSKTGIINDAVAQGTADPAHPFAGPTQCRSCHQPQSDFWLSTRHARSYASLQRVKQERNTECLPCHVTSQIKGSPKNPAERTELLTLPSSLQSVGCEICHGPGRTHAENPESSKPNRAGIRQVCVNCHTQERDPGFSYEEKVKDIQCPSR